MEKKTVKPASQSKLKTSAAKVKAATPPAAKRVPFKGAAVPTEVSTKTEKKPKKSKVIRDSFTMPRGEYAKIDELKSLGLTVGVAAKKSELLRAGLILLTKLTSTELKAAIKALDSVRTGRPT